MSNDILIMNKTDMINLKKEFMTRSTEVEQLQAALNNLLQGTTWDGKRARQFRELWAAEFAPNLAKLQAALRENGAFIGKERANAVTAMDS